MRIGPSFIKIGKAILYPLEELEDPHIHRVLSSYDVLGGPHTFNVLWCTTKFHDDNPRIAGALLGRVPDAFSLMADFHVVYAIIVALSVVCGLLGIFAGLAVLANQGVARKLALIAATLSVSDLPFGTTLGIFTLIALLPLRGGFATART